MPSASRRRSAAAAPSSRWSTTRRSSCRSGCGYYSRFFAPEDIYVLDNDTSDGSTERDGFVRIPVAHDTVDHSWMMRTMEGLQHELLERYDAVLVTDVDEIVARIPTGARWASTSTASTRNSSTASATRCCTGGPRAAPPAGPADPGAARSLVLERWLRQARAGDHADDWKPGFHGRADEHFNLDPDLRLIHLHRMDYDICLARHRSASASRGPRRTSPRAGRSTTGSWTTPSSSAGSTEDSGFPAIPIEARKDPGRVARAVLKRLRAARDRLLLPEAASGREQWQRCR